MAEVTKIGTITNSVQLGRPTVATLNPPSNCNRAGLLAGELIAGGDACYIKSDGKVYRSIQNVNAAPAALTVAGNGSGSSYGAGTHQVQATYVTAQGESAPSPPVNVTLTSAQNIRVTTFGSSLDASITGANFYVDGLFTATAAVSGAAIPQTDLTGATPASAKSVPTGNKAYKDAAWMCDGFAMESASSGEAVTLYQDVLFNYGAALTPGAVLYISGSVAGGLATTNPGGSTWAAEVFDATRIWVKRVKA